MQIAAVVQAKHMHAHRKVISLINEYRYHVTIFIEGTFIYPRFLLSFAKDEESVDNNSIPIVLFLGGWREVLSKSHQQHYLFPNPFVFILK